MDALVGSALTVAFELQGPTGSLPPEFNSVSYTLYGHTGAVLDGPTNVPASGSNTRLSVELSAGFQTIAVGRKYEKRMVRLTWLSGGRTHEQRYHYRVVPMLTMSVSCSDVRGMLGVTEDELPDQDIDLIAAYFQIEDEVTTAVLEAALVDGSVKELSANRVIAAQAAIATIPSLQLRIASSVSDGVQKFSRMSKIDFAQLAAALSAIRTEALATTQGTTNAVFTGVVLTVPTDAITGL